MTRHHSFTRSRDEPFNPIPQVPNQSHTTRLFQKVRRAARTSSSRMSVSFAEAEPPKENEHKPSHPTQVADSKRPRHKRRSLSTMSHNSARGYGQHVEGESGSDLDSEAEELSWNIINQEINEWQYVCRTGRPFWWSPEVKNSCFLTPPKDSEMASTRAWMRKIEDSPKSNNATHRKANSESNLAESTNVEELAQIIAVQLLGACFTLPPEYLVHLDEAPTTYNRKGCSKPPNNRMISSLRMHTQFRYSPCFGHQARTTSPIQPWAAGYDGISADDDDYGDASGMKTPTIGNSGPARRRNRLQKAPRALHVTEKSTDSCCLEGYTDANFAQLRNQDDIDTSKAYRGVHPLVGPKTKYRLQPVLRSEPHPVFVQPVRELVVKRWRSLRRQFGGSLHSAVPTRASEEVGSDSASGATSPALSSDARSRRRRAQERGDIDSGSIESSPRYNTPTIDNMTPTGSERTSMQVFETPPTTDESLISTPTHLDDDDDEENQPEQVIRPPDSNLFLETGGYISPNMIRVKKEAGFFFIQSKPNVSLAPPEGFRKGQHRTSMLSEVCVPEDYDDETAKTRDQGTAHEDFVKALSTSFAPSSEEGNLSSIQRPNMRRQVSENGSERPKNVSEKGKDVQRPGMGRTSSNSTQIFRPNSDSIGVDDLLVSTRNGKETKHPSMVRTSTNGTQIFRPGSDGIEIDGLPVGPGKDFWDDSVDRKGNRKERSFL